MTERTIRIKGLISGQVDMGTFGLVELELLSIEKEMFLEFEKAQQAMDEREVMINAFDSIRKEFLGRWWLKEGRGNYPYDDERYKEEVRYIMDAFNEIESNVWKNIKSKSFEYRKSIEKPLLEKIERLELELKEIGCQKIKNETVVNFLVNIAKKKGAIPKKKAIKKAFDIQKNQMVDLLNWCSKFKNVLDTSYPKEDLVDMYLQEIENRNFIDSYFESLPILSDEENKIELERIEKNAGEILKMKISPDLDFPIND